MRPNFFYLSLWLSVILAVVGVASSLLHAQDNLADTEIKSSKIVDDIYLLEGSGGNMALSVGEDGAFLIDDQFAPLTEKILAEVAKYTDQPVLFALNTHWHRDHTGGNENLRKAGAVLVAHENVREQMSKEHVNEFLRRVTPPSPEGALPVVTFRESLIFHLNGDQIHVFHVPHAHTDGDAIVHFKESNVFHLGDIYWSEQYPFIDPTSGGSINGVIDAVDQVLGMVDGRTKIIPGHGSITGVKRLKVYRNMLADIRDQIVAMMDEGKNIGQIISAKPTAQYDEEWGGGFIKPNRFVHFAVVGLERLK